MKLFKRFLTGLSMLALVSLFGVRDSQAQIWAYYDMEIDLQFFNFMPTGGPAYRKIDDFEFKDFAGNIDRDDGVVNDVQVGFDFEYNGRMFNTINVCVNGWASVGPQTTPVITHDKYFLFRVNEPNNTMAPFWGDHFYRTGSDIGAGYTPGVIHTNTIAVPDPNPCAPPGSFIRTFILEWRNLNINDKPNVNSIGTFQIRIIENPFANANQAGCVPDKRATLEFHYGPVGSAGTVFTQGSTVGIEDSVSDVLSHSFMNGLIPSSVLGEEPARTNDDSLTTCWPPASCLPGRVIQFTPEGRGRMSEWGDGDVNLTQLDNGIGAEIRLNQNRFVTLADADSLLRAVAIAYPPLDSVEGRQAFHGDANHNGRYENPMYPGFFFYRVSSYDAAYILMYLAAKLPFLPWPEPLPVPVYKESNTEVSNISGIYADTKATEVRGSTIYVPVVLRGTVNGPIAFDMDVKSLDPNSLQLVGAESKKGLAYHNAQSGKVVFAAAGQFADGDVLAYLQFTSTNASAEFELTNIMINDESYASSRATLAAGGGQDDVIGNSIEQNSPNPFNMGASSLTTIRYSVVASSPVTIKVYDMFGTEIRTLIANATVTAGSHNVQWDGRDNTGAQVASGAYYYQIVTPEFTETVKMNVIR